MNKHTLPKLTYAYDALEPYMDAKTLEIHYSKHHQTYCDKFNLALEKHPELYGKPVEDLLKNLNGVPEDIRTAVRNFGGGFYNHNFFWQVLGISGPLNPGALLKEIDKTFGSFTAFKEKFSEQALSLFGSGWTWLVLHNGKLEIVNTQNQDCPLSSGKIPLLTTDVWEHAYYLKYQNRRKDFIDAFWNVVNWHKVEENYKKGLK